MEVLYFVAQDCPGHSLGHKKNCSASGLGHVVTNSVALFLKQHLSRCECCAAALCMRQQSENQILRSDTHGYKVIYIINIIHVHTMLPWREIHCRLFILFVGFTMVGLLLRCVFVFPWCACVTYFRS